MGKSPAGARKSDGVPAESEQDASDPATASAGGTQARQHRGSADGESGEAGGLVVLAVLATVFVLVVRRTGLPTFRRTASRPAHR